MFTHLHTHSEYSLLDGLSKISDLVREARTLGQDALAITDHGALYGAIELYETATANDVKPIIGLEAYVAPGSRTERDANLRWPYHLTLLAQNETGYRNLIKLSSASHLEGFYYRPRIDRELLEQYNEGLIVLSGCPSGELMKLLADGREEDALQAAGWYRDLFPGRYYIELQEHGQEQFSRLTPGLVDLGKGLDLPLVLTNDSHYTTAAQHQHHDVLLCIGTNSTIHDANRFSLEGESFYLKSEEEMRALLPELPEAADNTARIAEQIEINLEFGRAQLPDPGIPSGTSPARYLRDLCDEGVQRYYGGELSEGQRERLDYELRIIEETGFIEYMLIVRDIAHFMHERRIPMGVRGSAAASMVLYCLGVIEIEPTQYRLVFERFLNPERLSMPDVDFDIADDRRDEVINYAANRFGRDHVAQIITFGTLGAKAAIRDTGRALGISYGDTDRVARLVPDTLGITIDRALDEVADLGNAYRNEDAVRSLIDTARGLEGVARHASTHAAAVVITREPLTDVLPVQRNITAKGAGEKADTEDVLPTTQYDMNVVEKIGLLKLDFLGLTNLTILGHAVDLIREQRGEEIDLIALPDGDEEAMQLFASADTFGIFQMESAGMRRYVAELQPRDIREVAAMVALYRPGPMEHISTYIDAKHGRTRPVYPHPDLAGILDETYGVIVYQDQVLEIAKQFAGHSLGQADVMRKAMGKKIPEVMLAEREGFVAGAVGRGYDQRLAEGLFDLIEPFAGYAFNKAHAFSYGVIAYQTAYLKAHYPVEFMTAVLVSAGGSQDRIAVAVAECTRLGIEVLPPDVTRSQTRFAIDRAPGADVPAIRFGLSQIKNVGAGAIDELIAERDAEGPFSSLEDFARRVNPRNLNRRGLESLAQAGALDSLDAEAGRHRIVAGVERILSLAQQEQRLRETGQTSMFDMFGSEVDTPLAALELPPADPRQEEVLRQELLAWEKELLGTYITEHPFADAREALSQFTTAETSDLTVELAGREEVVAGAVTIVRPLTTRQGKPFAAITIEDMSGQTELTIWPDSYVQWNSLLVQGEVLLALVEIRERGDRLTVAVKQLAAYDREARAPIDFDRGRFTPRSPTPGRRRAADRPSGPPPRDDDAPHPQPAGTNGRGQLRAVEPPPQPPANGNGNGPSSAAAALDSDPGGPRRLRITMEETTDEPADRRRLNKIVEQLSASPGELPVELLIQTRGGRLERLQFSAAVSADGAIPRVSALLGVLGSAAEVGEMAAAAGEGFAVASGG